MRKEVKDRWARMINARPSSLTWIETSLASIRNDRRDLWSDRCRGIERSGTFRDLLPLPLRHDENNHRCRQSPGIRSLPLVWTLFSFAGFVNIRAFVSMTNERGFSLTGLDQGDQHNRSTLSLSRVSFYFTPSLGPWEIVNETYLFTSIPGCNSRIRLMNIYSD